MDKRNIKIFVIIFIIMSIIFLFFIPQIFAATNEELKQQIEANNKKIEELRQQQASQEEILATFEKQDKLYESQLSALKSQVNSFTVQINKKTAEIKAAQTKITNLNNEIEQTKVQIDEQNKVIEDTYELLSKRLKAMYIAGNTSDLEILLTSNDFSSFLTRTELLRRVSEHDTALIKDLEEKIKELNKMVDNLEKKKGELQEEKEKLDDEKRNLVTAKNNLQSSLNEVQKTADKIETQRKDNAKKLKSLANLEAYYVKQNEKADAEILANINSNSQGSGAPTGSNFTNSYGYKVSSKGFILPLQYSDVYISAGYPYYPSGRRHTGIDYCCWSGTYKKQVRAAAGGVVTEAGYRPTSYGNYIIIDHGNGISTLYGHATELLVSKGQRVSQGQVIMLSGTTGNSTGCHVHFSVILNGQYVNPANYVSL